MNTDEIYWQRRYKIGPDSLFLRFVYIKLYRTAYNFACFVCVCVCVCVGVKLGLSHIEGGTHAECFREWGAGKDIWA